tara:strand:- start:996 stop:1238 length:243 start_codon:yes stop_codon:yes gene_type:complete
MVFALRHDVTRVALEAPQDKEHLEQRQNLPTQTSKQDCQFKKMIDFIFTFIEGFCQGTYGKVTNHLHGKKTLPYTSGASY